jgi:hypothetical protein
MDITPQQLFPGITSDGTSITIPLTDLPGLSAAEADATTGDGRKVFYGIIEQSHQALSALDAANRPQKMSLTKQQPAGVGVNQVRVPYGVSFDLTIDPDIIEVSPEA